MSSGSDLARLCYGCGRDNDRGLGLRFRVEDGRAVAEFTPEQFLQGFPGYMHGGGVATVLDEAMGWAAYAAGVWAMTAKFTMRFRRPVPLQQQVRVSGWLTLRNSTVCVEAASHQTVYGVV